MTSIAIVSDTHVPSRAPSVPEWVADRLAAADHVVHAGDFDSPAAFERVRELAGGAERLTAVRGNADPRSLDLPRVATVERGGVTLVVTHGDGTPHDYRERVAARVRSHGGPDAVGVCGHTHERMDERADGVRLLNPGSATGVRPAREASMFLATADDGALDVSVHRR
ncbi:MAG: metallophosphoesterase family protein [Haloferacaceae archaeon]